MTVTVDLEKRRFSWERLLFNRQVLILTLSQTKFLHKENFILSLQLLDTCGNIKTIINIKIVLHFEHYLLKYRFGIQKTELHLHSAQCLHEY